MEKFKQFVENYRNENWTVVTKDGLQLETFTFVSIGDFFEDIPSEVNIAGMTFEEFFKRVTEGYFQEMHEDTWMWYYFKDWDEDSQAYFKELCEEVYACFS